MINVSIDTSGCREIKLKGHAGAGEIGKDIVCAAVSALFRTLAYSLNQSGLLYECSDNLDPDEGITISTTNSRAFPVFDYTINGLKMLSEEAPEYVSFTNTQ